MSAGCQTLTGRSPGRWADDRVITTRVKTRLAAVGITTLTRIHVDTWGRTVYLTGAVGSPELKQRAETLASTVPNVDLVVNNLHVEGEEVVAASPRTDRAELAEHAVLAQRTGLVRLDTETGTPTWTRYAAYDQSGRRAATVYLMPEAVLAGEGVGDLPADVPVERLSVYPDPSHGRYYLVLWHAERSHVATDP